MKILLIHGSSELYGSDRVLLDLALILDNLGYDLEIAVPCEGPLTNKFIEHNIPFHVGNVGKLKSSSLSIGGFVGFLYDLIKSQIFIFKLNKIKNFDLICSNTSAVWGGALFSMSVFKQHVWYVHETIPANRIINNIFSFAINALSTKIIVVSNAVLFSFSGVFLKSLIAKSSVIYNGITPVNLVSDYTSGFINVAIIGRLSLRKGHKNLIQAAAILKTNGFSNVKFFIVGDIVPGNEAYKDELVELIAKLKLEESFEFINFQSNLTQVWLATHVCVVPSVLPESFGLVAAEAMSYSIPVIASNLGGLSEIVVHNKTGYLVEADSESIAIALKQLTSDLNNRKKMGFAGRDIFMKKFHIDIYNDRIRDFFKGL